MVTSISPDSAIKGCMYALQMKPNCAIQVLQSLHGQWSGIQNLILVLNSFKVLHFLTLCGTSFHIFGAKVLN